MKILPVTVVSGLSREVTTQVVSDAIARAAGRRIALTQDFDEAMALVAKQSHDAVILLGEPTDSPLAVLESFAQVDAHTGEEEGHVHGPDCAHDHHHGHSHGHDHAHAPENAALDALVTVIDARTFLKDYLGSDALEERGLASHDDGRTVSDVLVDQVEAADVIVVHGASEAKEGARLQALLTALNPRARIVPCDTATPLSIDALVNTGLFDFDETPRAASWMQALTSGAEEATHTTTPEYGLTRFVFRARRPLHPGRFWDFVNSEGHGILRSKGFLWLATRPDFVSLWSQAGNSCQLDPEGTWWAYTPPTQWPHDEHARATILVDWDATWGDRRQELVLMGLGLQEEKLTLGLKACLLTDEEFAAGEASWVLMDDPFPSWAGHLLTAEHDEDEHDHAGHAHVHADGSVCTHPSHAHDDHAHGKDHVHAHDHAHDHHDHDHDGEDAFAERETLDAEERAHLASLSLGELEALVDDELASGNVGYAVAAQEVHTSLVSQDDWAALAMARFKLALLQGQVGETHRSLPLFREAIRALETNATGEPWMLCEIIHTYGEALVAVSEPARAEEVHVRGLEVAERTHQQAWESQFALSLGALRAEGDPDVSVALYRRAVALREKLGDRTALGTATLTLGLALANASSPDAPAARDALEKALALLGADEEFEHERAQATEALTRVKAQGLRSKLRLDL